MPRVSLGFDTFEDWQGVSIDVNNLCLTGREWWEKSTATGRYRRDRLTFASATTGLPTQLVPGTYAETVIACIEPGDYVVNWSGTATIEVVLIGGVTTQGSGRFTFTHPGNGITQAIVRVRALASPLVDLRVVRSTREAQWQDFSPQFHQRADELRPPWLRFLNMFEPNAEPWRQNVETVADIRPDTWWTQANGMLDLFTLAVGGWSGATPGLGSQLAIERWNGTAWGQIGTVDVTNLSPFRGKVAGQAGQLAGGVGSVNDRVRDVDNGSTATLTASMAQWMGTNRGPSIKMVRDICAAMRAYGAVGAILNMHPESDAAVNTAWVDAIRADARLNGFLWCAENGNERWNPSLAYGRQYTRSNNLGVAAGMPMNGSNVWEAGAQWHAREQHLMHELWVARLTLSGLQANYRRFFMGQLRGGAYWADYHTILNPESLAGFPSYPRTVYPIDCYFVAGYAGQVDEAPYNTVAWQRAATPQDWHSYIVGNQFPLDITGPTSAMRALRVWATARGCQLGLYEFNFHLLAAGGDVQADASIRSFLRSPEGGLTMQELLTAYETESVDITIAYNSVRAWGRSSGYWGFIEGYYNSEPNVLWAVAVRHNAGIDYTLTFPGAQQLSTVNAAVIEIEVGQTVDLFAETAGTLHGANTVDLLSSMPPDDETDMVARPLGYQTLCLPLELQLVSPPVDLELPVFAAGTRYNGRQATMVSEGHAAEVEMVARVASTRTSSSAVAVLSEDPGLGGGFRALAWQADMIGPMAKVDGARIVRGSLLGEVTFAADEVGGGDWQVMPLVAGQRFGGVAMEYASPSQRTMLRSRSGTMLVDLEAPATPGDVIEVVALDDQRLVARTYAEDQLLPFTSIGRGLVRGDGLVLMDYRQWQLEPTDKTLLRLRDRALSPALYADVIPEGVLSRVGFAAWEQPAIATGGGYMHWLHQIVSQAGHLDAYDLYLTEPLRTLPGIATKDRMLAMHNACLEPPYGTMDLAQLDDGGTFAVGSTLTLQNTVFAPCQVSQVATPTNYDYLPEIALIRARWSKSLTLHCGLANNPSFFGGSFYFNNDNPLKCRAAENPYRDYVDFATYAIGTTDYVFPLQIFGADAQTALWPKTSYDPTIPAVFALCLDHVAELVTAYGTSVRYSLHGENQLAISTDSGEVKTNFSAASVVGFRSYMENVLGLTIEQANTRWGTDVYNSYEDVDPSAAPFGALTVQYQDFLAYLRWMIEEMATAQLHKALEINPFIEASCFRFGADGMQRSWLQSRYGSVGDWIGQTVSQYRQARDFSMNATARAGRLSGVPVAFPITAPPFVFNPAPSGQEDVPPVLRSYRTYTDAELGLLFTDLMTCGEVGVAYLFSPMAGFGADPASVAAVKRAIAGVVAAHPTTYARTGPLSRLCIEADTLDLANAATGTGGARIAYWLSKTYRNVQPALFSSASVRKRGLAREALRRALTVVTFPANLVAIKDDYVELLPANATGAAIILAYRTGSLPAWVDPTPVEEHVDGNLYMVMDAGLPTNVFLFEVRPITGTRDQFFSDVVKVLSGQFIPRVQRFVAPLGTIPFALLPFTLTSSDPENLVANWTTDGVNFTLHLSNLSALPIQYEAAVDTAVSSALAVSHTPAVGVIQPYQTTVATLEATFSDVDLARAINDATDKLSALGAGFVISAGQALLAQATALLATHPGRAIAAYIAAVRMVYVRAEWSSPNLSITARRITLPRETTAPEAVAGARVQVLFPLNVREEHPAADVVTDAAGFATIEVGTPVEQRLDLATGALVPPSANANTHVEVHVTDSRGSSTRQIVLTPSP